MSHPFRVFHSGRIQERSRESARRIVPLLVNWFQPSSVVDVGCGAGTWLSVFRDMGVVDILGMDGSWVDQKNLEIPSQRFIAWDLRTPIRLQREFDLVVSLEVAQYLPEACANQFVDSLTRLGTIVLFSSAIPGQWGTHHRHEQWPGYWAERFRQRGYSAVDCIRHRIWEDDRVDWWYAQNSLLYIHEHVLKTLPPLNEYKSTESPLALVHPQHYELYRWMNRTLEAETTVYKFHSPGSTLALVDDAQFGESFASGLHVVRLCDREGKYEGPPKDAESAISELEQAVKHGADTMVIGWPAFWWLEYYAELSAYVHKFFECLHEDENIKIFSSRAGSPLRKRVP